MLFVSCTLWIMLLLYGNEYVKKKFRKIASEIVKLNYPELTT